MGSGQDVGEVCQNLDVSAVLAAMTGRPKEEFEAEGYDHPHPDELEEVPRDEW